MSSKRTESVTQGLEMVPFEINKILQGERSLIYFLVLLINCVILINALFTSQVEVLSQLFS